MTPDTNKRVQVYKNLHKDMWSVRQAGKIIFHCNRLILRDVKFHVQPAGRDKVRREGKKNVHAYLSGYLFHVRGLNKLTDDRYLVVTYNPYKHDTFVTEHSEPIYSAPFADMDVHDLDPVLAIWKKL